MTIKFGTDGWRAVIAETITFENLRLVSQAVADHLLEMNGTKDPEIVSILSAEYNHTDDFNMKMEIIFALNYLDPKTAIPALKNIRDKEEDERLRGLIDRKLHTLGDM